MLGTLQGTVEGTLQGTVCETVWTLKFCVYNFQSSFKNYC